MRSATDDRLSPRTRKRLNASPASSVRRHACWPNWALTWCSSSRPRDSPHDAHTRDMTVSDCLFLPHANKRGVVLDLTIKEGRAELL